MPDSSDLINSDFTKLHKLKYWRHVIRNLKVFENKEISAMHLPFWFYTNAMFHIESGRNGHEMKPFYTALLDRLKKVQDLMVKLTFILEGFESTKQLASHPAAKPLSDNRDQGDGLFGCLYRELFVCMGSKSDLRAVGLDEQAACFCRFYEAESVDSLMRQFDAWIGDTERLITDGVIWESGGPSTTH